MLISLLRVFDPFDSCALPVPPEKVMLTHCWSVAIAFL